MIKGLFVNKYTYPGFTINMKKVVLLFIITKLVRNVATSVRVACIVRETCSPHHFLLC